METAQIETRPRPACPVCESPGHMLYTGLADRLFGTPWEWDLRRCGHRDCGTLWLDPMPEEADLPKLYATYYTHQEGQSSDRLLRRWAKLVGAAYLDGAYGYVSGISCWRSRLLSMMVHLHPMWKSTLDASVFYLPVKPAGRLLEIGCGSGADLLSMKDKGWDVVGVDFDALAVSNATNKGLDVRLGQLSNQGFADESFDAIVMSHVIEHVPDPGKLAKECLKMLKRDGILVLLTPNADSAMHSRYGSNWVCIDVPRHLQVFTPGSLSALAERAGFRSVVTSTSMNGFVYEELASTELEKGEVHIMGGPVSAVRLLQAHIKGLWLGWLQLLSPYRGAELAVVCRK